MIDNLKNFIYKEFNINLKDKSINIIFNCTEGNEELKTYAMIGDKLVDFLDSYYQKEKQPLILDNFRKEFAGNEYWIRCFESWNFEPLIYFNISNPLGKKVKATFIEALIFCFFDETEDIKKTYNALTLIRSKV